ncbi:MAG TPA: CAP domain-containing protein [Anaerolineales bacterium]
MINKLFIVTALIMLALSACNGQAPVETATSTLTETETQVPTALVSITEAPVTTETFTPIPIDTSATATSATPLTASQTPTVGTPRPTNVPDCTNSASFVADVTIPDNTNVAGGTTFTKTWRVSNTGTCIWGPDYKLTHYSDEQLGAPDSVPLAITYPSQTADISVDLIAPNSIGTHQGNFVIENPVGLIMKIGDDSRLWAIIKVTVTTAATVAVTTTATTLSNTAVSTVAVTNTASTTTSNSSFTTATCAFTTDRTKLTEVITAVNAYRAQHGLPAYTVNAQLAQAAQRHANDIACHKLYVHTGSDGSTPQTRVADTGYVAKSVSENVNGNYPPLNGQDVVNWWINDKTDLRHGQNLLSTTFTEIGVGYSFFDNYGFYALVFAKP